MASSDHSRKSESKGFVPPDPALRVSEARGRDPVRSKFPGPRDARAIMRVAMDRDAYAQISSHAAESTAAEICGVLAGTVCEDEGGIFLHVTAAVRGESSRSGSTHVTFTHETWESIHKTLEKTYPKLEIVGWYHSHPGFGVEFSEMDIFIQKNFFKTSTHVALVIDPLGGQTAMCLDTPEGIKYIDRFWVDGRERSCQIPQRGSAAAAPSPASAPSPEVSPDLAETLKLVQTRLTQAIQMIDEQRASNYRMVVMFGMVVCTAVVFWIFSSLWRNYYAPLTPPEMRQYIDIPIMIDGKVMKVGVAVASWQVPEELNAIYLQMEKERQQAAAAKAAAATAATAPAGSATRPGPN